MKKISASLALGLLSQHVYAAGFIEDSKASRKRTPNSPCVIQAGAH